jgi:putative FmdB family regulatory protein
MPLFEYKCRECGHPFEAFVTADRPAACPSCGSTNLNKLLSSPGMVGVASGSERRHAEFQGSGGCGAGGDACACRAGMVN